MEGPWIVRIEKNKTLRGRISFPVHTQHPIGSGHIRWSGGSASVRFRLESAICFGETGMGARGRTSDELFSDDVGPGFKLLISNSSTQLFEWSNGRRPDMVCSLAIVAFLRIPVASVCRRWFRQRWHAVQENGSAQVKAGVCIFVGGPVRGYRAGQHQIDCFRFFEKIV